MKYKFYALLLLALSAIILAAIPLAPSNLTAITITHLDSTPNPVVEFAVPDDVSSELVFTSQSNLVYSQYEQHTLVYVGCTNVTEFAWQTRTNVGYAIWVRTNSNDQWLFSKIRIIGDGNPFRFYSVADQNRQFQVRPY
jgi:hypothetical protein